MFLQNVYWSALVLHHPPLPWKISCYAPTLKHYSFCKTLYLKCLTVFWIRLCLNNCSMICAVTLCYVLYQTHSEPWHIQHFVFSGRCWHIHSYSALLRHIHAYWVIFQAYSGIFSTLCNPHLFKTLWNIDEAYSQPCHRALFSHIQTYKLLQHLHMEKPGIFRILEYSKPLHNCTLMYI